MKSALITLVTTLVACAPSSSPSLTESQRTAIADTIRQRSRDWEAAAEAANVEQVIALYHTGPDVALVRDQRLMGVDSLRAGLLSDFANTKSQQVEVLAQQINVVSADAVAETATGKWTTVERSGRSTTGTFSVSRLWTRRDGTWGILHNNLHVAMPPAAAATRQRP